MRAWPALVIRPLCECIQSAVRDVRMLVMDATSSPAVSDSACMAALVIFFLTGLAFLVTLAFFVMGGIRLLLSSLVDKEELKFKMCLLWPQSVKCHKTIEEASGGVSNMAGEFRIHRYWPI